MKSTDLQGKIQFDESAVRQGRSQCDVCHGQGHLQDGQVTVGWKSPVIQRNRRTGAIRKSYKNVARGSHAGETCPACFGMRYSHDEIEDEYEAEAYRQPTNGELVKAMEAQRGGGKTNQTANTGLVGAWKQFVKTPQSGTQQSRVHSRQGRDQGFAVHDTGEGDVLFTFDD